MPDPDSIIRPISRTLRWLVAATVVLALVLGAVTIKTYHDTQVTRDDAQITHNALCSLRTDLDKRTKVSADFLVKHPKGTPGIPAATIQQSVNNQQQTIYTLRKLSC